MRGWPRNVKGSCAYTEEAVVECQQGEILHLGIYGEITLSLFQTLILRSVFIMPWVGLF
jgi:hypothetical protein